MAPSFKLTGLCTVAALLCSWACEPDLDSLEARYQGGASGSSVTGTGGSSNAGMGGDMVETGGSAAVGGDGTGGTGGTGGINGTGGTGNAEGGMAGEGMAGTGDAGAPPGPVACDNLERDVNESDVDCGGTSTCPRCDTNLRCGANLDCLSGFCKATRCAEPTCGDGYKNQDETATDCGGSCAPALGCDLDEACEVNEDCASEFCKDEVCVDHCGSGKREADETDLDCGGVDCGPCGDERNCEKAADCVSKICFNNECQPATCSDNVQNQDESDKDCGGVCIPDKPCDISDSCNGPTDCDSYVCTEDACAPDLDIDADDFIDDFEDGNFLVDAGDLVGNWYPYGDGTGTVTADIGAPARGIHSDYGLHTTGTGFTYWGSGIGVDLNNSGGQQSTKRAYDASAYTGVTFWAHASSTLSVTVVFPNGDTDAAGGTGVCDTDPDGICDHHWFSSISVGTTWKRFTVPFASLSLEAGGYPVPTAFDPGTLVSVQFRMQSGLTYELWIDDVAFVR
jgi:hypothetical protein